ncbi:hypothetical protein ID866_11170 [Astraeus odoratus]|nr:hypothetical protein ID866_11170 [Astraeus odoratus]
MNLRYTTHHFGTGHVIYCRILVLDLILHLMHNACTNTMGRGLFVLLMNLGQQICSGTSKYVVQYLLLYANNQDD